MKTNRNNKTNSRYLLQNNEIMAVYVTNFDNLKVIVSQVCVPCSKGSAEDKLTDSAPKFAKIRPMRVEMSGMNWNDSWGKIYHEAIRRDTIYRVSTAG